jgi:hypothetical protein
LGKLHTDFYVIGDEAFTCTRQFSVPWSGTGIGIARDTFNYCLSVRRQVIERVFGRACRFSWCDHAGADARRGLLLHNKSGVHFEIYVFLYKIVLSLRILHIGM